jgi:peptidoglycan/xylan/chitin deacetylase (PgdA/CDA1 family)
MRGTGYIRKAFNVLRRRIKRGAVILLYHRVASLPSDAYSLAVSPGHFEQQLDYICRTCQPMRLIDLVDALQQRLLPHRAVAITFDDGYVDNFEHAYPLLRSTGIPATVFVVSEKIGSLREFWWDELERALLLPRQLPENLRITIAGREHEWHLDSLEERRQAHRTLQGLLRPLDADSREALLDELAEWAGVVQKGRPGYRTMTISQLVELARSEVVDIGGHTMTHPRLPALSVDAQRTEVVGGRQRLESLIGDSILTFAYPYGTRQDFTDSTVDIVRAAGFRAACTTLPGSVEPADDVFRLRRCAVFDWSADLFKRQLESFFVTRG